MNSLNPWKQIQCCKTVQAAWQWIGRNSRHGRIREATAISSCFSHRWIWNFQISGLHIKPAHWLNLNSNLNSPPAISGPLIVDFSVTIPSYIDAAIVRVGQVEGTSMTDCREWAGEHTPKNPKSLTHGWPCLMP